jgi:hypothetical protein
MFSIAVSPTYAHPVTGVLPGGVEVAFSATFHRLAQADTEALVEQARKGELSDIQVIARVLAGWEFVADEAGVPMPFTPDNLSRLLAVYGVPAAIVRSWFRSITDAREKN